MIPLIGLHPLSGDWPDGPALRFVVDTAIDHVNQSPHILPGYKLNVTWINSGVSTGLVTNYREGGGGLQQVLPLRKGGGGGGSFSHAEGGGGGTQSVGVVFFAVA